MNVACFDLETSNLSANFGILLCANVKPWHGKSRTLHIGQFEHEHRSNDKALVEAVIDELNKYTILVAHNGVRFDRPFLNSRAAMWGVPPLSPKGNMVDPVQLARKHLRMSYNGLDSVAQFLQTKHQKTPVQGHLWIKAVLDRDPIALNEIIKHCELDVLVLEEVMEKLVPFVGQINQWGSA